MHCFPYLFLGHANPHSKLHFVGQHLSYDITAILTIFLYINILYLLITNNIINFLIKKTYISPLNKNSFSTIISHTINYNTQ
jgi:branched-subunit amino acid transport protein AzlD